MTAVDPFTTPAEAEQEALLAQARNLLARATSEQRLATWGSSTNSRINYENGVEAIRDALTGQGHVLLAVHTELADIAASLRTLASAPSVLQQLADHTSGLVEAVNEHGDGIGERTATVVDAVHAHGEVVDSAVSGVLDVMDRPRWWQWRRRRALHAMRDILPKGAAIDLTALAEDSTVREYLVEVRQADGEVLGRSRFHAEPHAACDMAAALLPGLCVSFDAKADPERVYGRVFLCKSGNKTGRYIDSVFMLGATTLPTLIIAGGA